MPEPLSQRGRSGIATEIDWSNRKALAAGYEGLFCIDNITYSDGRWEAPFYTMDFVRARGYWDWLMTGGWRGMRFQQFRDGEWRDVASEAVCRAALTVLGAAELIGDPELLQLAERRVAEAGLAADDLKRWARQMIERHGHEWVVETARAGDRDE